MTGVKKVSVSRLAYSVFIVLPVAWSLFHLYTLIDWVAGALGYEVPEQVENIFCVILYVIAIPVPELVEEAL